MNRINRRVKTQLFLLAMVLLLSACGQRGPLYLPEKEQGSVESKETEATKTEVTDTEEHETGEKETEDDRENTPGAQAAL